MKRIFIYIFFSCCTTTVIAQEQFIEKRAKFITKFPFRQLSGGVILIQAKFNNNAHPLNFILDTGSGGISLDSATCLEFKIPHSPSGRTINGIAGIKEVDFAKNNTLVLPGLKVEGLDFYINDYGILSSVYGEKIDGIIGYSFFSRYIVKVNYDSINIEIFNPGSIRYPSGGYLLHPLFTTLPIQSLLIKENRTIEGNFYIDTGAGLSFLLSKDFEQDSLVLRPKRKQFAIDAQGMGGKKRMMITVIKEVKLGPYRFRKVPTYILDDEYNATSYPFLGGLLGSEILKKFNIIFNYKKREIHLLPNSHFRESFEYSYTGLSLFFIDGKVVIDDIIPGSPADKARFKKDDIVISINNNFSNNINEYKDLLQLANDRVKVLILRDNTPLLINFKVGRIY
ncbi:MAG: aspartyl protease family protein [Ginsengibacter sp.]